MPVPVVAAARSMIKLQGRHSALGSVYALRLVDYGVDGKDLTIQSHPVSSHRCEVLDRSDERCELTDSLAETGRTSPPFEN